MVAGQKGNERDMMVSTSYRLLVYKQGPLSSYLESNNEDSVR